MKKIFLLFLMMFSLTMFAQDITCYSYKIKLSGISNADLAKQPTDLLRIVFKVNPNFNDSLDQFEFNSSISVNQTGFDYLAQDEGYQVLYFLKTSCVDIEEKNKLIYKEEGE